MDRELGRLKNTILRLINSRLCLLSCLNLDQDSHHVSKEKKGRYSSVVETVVVSWRNSTVSIWRKANGPDGLRWYRKEMNLQLHWDLMGRSMQLVDTGAEVIPIIRKARIVKILLHQTAWGQLRDLILWQTNGKCYLRWMKQEEH